MQDQKTSQDQLERVLVVDDDEMVLDSLEVWIGKLGAEVVRAETGARALDLLSQTSYDAMVTDLMLPDMNGLELMQRAQAIQPDLQVIILTSYSSVESAIQAIRAGAFDYLQKPAYPETIQHTLRRLARQRSLQRQVEALQSALERPFHEGSVVARSHQMRHVLEQVRVMAESHAPVLIEGEPGTGKEVVARYLQAESSRADGPFVTLSSGQYNDEELGRLLFGNGADPRTCLLSRADRGILYLRNVHRLPPKIQLRLLQYLQDHALRDEWGNVVCRPDVRLVASSPIALADEVAAGRFREDLYYKIAVFRINIPPLRERTLDILALADHFLQRAATERNPNVRRLHRRTLALLMEYAWPRNATELEEVITQAVLAAEGPEVLPEHLPSRVRREVADSPVHWRRSLKDLEREHIERVLDAVGWNRSKAAEILGIRRMTLYNKLKEYGLQPPDKEGDGRTTSKTER